MTDAEIHKLSWEPDMRDYNGYIRAVPFARALESRVLASKSAESGKEEADDDIEECREILTDLISNIEQDGMYSKEATLTFLRQALLCLKKPDWPANPSDKQEAGWQLVPKKHEGKAGLTDAMMRAFYEAFERNERRGSFERLNAAYNAMLEAAPLASPPAKSAESGKEEAKPIYQARTIGSRLPSWTDQSEDGYAHMAKYPNCFETRIVYAAPRLAAQDDVRRKAAKPKKEFRSGMIDAIDEHYAAIASQSAKEPK